MQESFLVWDPKAYFKKGRERQVFLFELCVVFAKKTELSSRAIKYTYKTHLMASVLFCLAEDYILGKCWNFMPFNSHFLCDDRNLDRLVG